MGCQGSRTRGPLLAGLSLLYAVAAPAETLSLPQAVDRALERSAAVEAARAAVEAGEARSDGARAAFLPRVDYRESFARSDNPVFVFGTLLTQRQFTEANFALDALNRPDPLSLFQSQFQLRQLLFQREAILGRREAGLGAEMARERERQAIAGTLFDVVRLYFGIQVSAKNLEVLRQGVESASRDRDRARALLEGGQVTEADRLALEVHVADLREREIRAANDLALLRSDLNRLLGAELDAELDLVTEIDPEVRLDAEASGLPELEAKALAERPEARQLEIQEDLAELGSSRARSSFLPTVSVNAGWESDRTTFTGTGGTNWIVGLKLSVNLFDGLGKVAKMREADAELRRARAEKRDREQSLRLEVRRAVLDLAAARERVDVARESVSQARESHRITEARYGSGLAKVTDLLRSQNALLAAEARVLASIYESRLAEVRVALVTGSLDRDAEVLRP